MMNLSRYSRARRCRAWIMIVVFVTTTFLPDYAWALTTGPHQPEFTSYEEPGATDLVNLLTGDLHYSIPLMEVPGPEGGFSLPLSYSAGIGTEQEASWVGLGWSLNAGSITREVNVFPDDAGGEVNMIKMVDLVGVRGWTSNNLFGTWQLGWNNVQGSYGSVNLLVTEFNYSVDTKGISSFSLAGISVGSKGFSINPVQFGMTALSVASFGASTAVENAANVGMSMFESAASSLSGSNSSPWSSNISTSNSLGYWSYNMKKVKQGFLHKDFWIWLDQTRSESMYGVLNLGSTPTGVMPHTLLSLNGATALPIGAYFMDQNNSGVASDVSYYIPSGKTFRDSNGPGSVATDTYTVGAPGISGSIKPYRLELGSVSVPRQMSMNHARYSVVPFGNYKVPFVYDGSISNSYLWQTGSNKPSFRFGLSGYNRYDPLFGSIQETVFQINDSILGNSAIRPDVSGSKKIAQSNHIEWIKNSEIIGTTGTFSNGFVDYFSGTARTDFRQLFGFSGNTIFESFSSTFPSDGYVPLTGSELSYFQTGISVTMDVTAYNNLADMQAHRTPVNAGSFSAVVMAVEPANSRVKLSVPSGILPYSGKYLDMKLVIQSAKKNAESIGGYSITKPDGMTYHFALPVYDYQFKTWVGAVNNPNTNYSTIERSSPFANTWLLTGITGADYVDRNANGIIDEADWGYWVKLNYSRYRSNYAWRVPFSGYNIDPENTSSTYSSGTKEIYYLNSIETRSHTALFLKDYRLDNRSSEQVVNSTLRLSEIALLTRDNYKALKSTAQIEDSGTIDSWWNYNSFYTSGGATSLGNYLTQKAIKRVRFTHTYDLCPGTLNSGATNQGKLTLTRLSFFGSNNAMIAPDYKFEYGQDASFSANYQNNPSYNANAWDGWGNYSSVGSTSVGSHLPSPNSSDAMAWSLTRVITPLGSSMDIVYERDAYSSIAGVPINGGTNLSYSKGNFDVPYYGGSSLGDLFLNNSSGQIKAGDVVRITGGNAVYYCSGVAVNLVYPPSGSSVDYTVVSAAPDRINVGVNYMNIPCSPTIGTNIHFDYNQGTVSVLAKANRVGGSLRVGSIILRDQGAALKTRYLYTGADGYSSGVVSQEPAFAKTVTWDYADLNPGFPSTPVMYSRVAILNGSLSSDTDYHTKTVYEFETPDLSQLTYGSTVTSTIKFRMIRNEISDYTAKIGSLKSTKVYDNQGVLKRQTILDYTSQLKNPSNQPYQGVYSEGTLMHDWVAELDNLGMVTSEVNKMTRTTTIKYPYQLLRTTTTQDAMSIESNNLAWDFYSGQVVDKLNVSALGVRTRTIISPAYAQLAYAGMGPKSMNISNANNLLAAAATYTYKVDAANNPVGLLSGTATVWTNTWNNYRVLTGSTYADGLDVPGAQIWRKSKDFTYVGTYAELQSDGTMNFNASKQFDITKVGGNPGWLQVGQVLRYDHYSTPLESKGMDSIRTSLKRDVNSMNIFVQGSNTSYHELAYSGAEDGAGSSLYFGGEVAKGAATIISNGTPGSTTHTGIGAVQLSVGAKSFTYKPASLKPGKTYRASVWTNSLNGAIYYNLNGAGEQTVLPVSTNVVGSWYQINVEIPVSTFSSFEIGVKSTAGTVNFDDFRFQPKDSQVTGTVYDANSGSPTFILDNDNMYTQYVYDNAGQLIKTYQESFKYGVKLVSEKRYNYRRFNTNP